jgi:N-acetylmuramoyl-L-alanine amidase
MRNERSDSASRFSFFRSRCCFLFAHFSLIVLISFATALPAQAAITIRRTWIERRGEVFTIHLRLSGRPRWTVSRDTGRLQIDLANARTGWPANQFLHSTVGSLGAVRIISGDEGTVRMQIDVTARCDFVVGRKHDDLIVILAPRGAGLNIAQAFGQSRGAPSQIPRAVRTAPAVVAAPPREMAPEQVARADNQSAPALVVTDAAGPEPVVVDVGHGGFDPGTRSADGLLEKDLALQIAHRLADALMRRGVQAVMTRDSDTYLSLAQRTAIANHASAELFVSIHLNWSSNPQTQGMEVYYLNNTTDRATIRLARMENAEARDSAPLDPNLNYILSDLQQQYKATESALLAQTMEEQTVNALQASFGDQVRALGAKRGPFYVLVGPRIPAVLVECGFLSNPDETARLATPAYQQAMADALAASIVHYLNQDVTAGTL